MAASHMSDAEFTSALAQWTVPSVLAPCPATVAPWLDRLTGPGAAEAAVQALRQPRSVQSAKSVLLAASEPVGRYGTGAGVAAAVEVKPALLLGVRACELRALQYLDKVMLGGEFDDPTYRARREALVLVSCDCVACAETCFCTLTGGQPYPTEGFGLNLTPLEDGWVLEPASDKGRALLPRAGLAQATPDQLARRDAVRRQMTDRVRAQNASYAFAADDKTRPPLPEGNDGRWGDFAADCVECGACTNICPTCHCFYLYDHAPSRETFERVRTWDSCLFATYHRMAGGVNTKLSPRPNLLSRLANRVLHKFAYSPQQYGLLGCVGCGRCVDACLGAIDIRQVVQELSG